MKKSFKKLAKHCQEDLGLVSVGVWSHPHLIGSSLDTILEKAGQAIVVIKKVKPGDKAPYFGKKGPNYLVAKVPVYLAAVYVDPTNKKSRPYLTYKVQEDQPKDLR